jgi:ATP-dependent RNA helicase DeaD
MPIEFVTTSAESRLGTLRRTLDSIDPASAVVFVRDRDSDVRVRDLLRSLGYSSDDAPIRAGLTAAPGTELVVLFDVPASREELREAAGAAKRVIALIQPRQLTSLRSLAAGGAVKPFTLTDSSARARDRDARIRAELRQLLADGHFGRELIALEPLLENYDGIEIAAAALQLAERQRAKTPAASATASPATPRERSAGPMVRLFVNVGERDGVRPGDLVGAITNQGEITSDDVGKVELRESHSIVEVSPGVADGVIERVTGMTIRGRRAIVRRDEQRSPRDAEPKARGGERGPRSSDRGERGAASGPRRYPAKGGGAGRGSRERTPPRRGDRE